MDDVLALQLEYFDAIQNIFYPYEKQLHLARELRFLARSYELDSPTKETSFTLGYLEFFYARELEGSYQKAYERILKSHEAGYAEASIFLAKLHMGYYP